MACWRDRYLSSLDIVERQSKVSDEIIAACCQLQDQVAALVAEKALQVIATEPKPAIQASHLADPQINVSVTPRLRLELAEAHRSQGQLRARLESAETELKSLRGTTRSNTLTLKTLTVEQTKLSTRVRDRDEELRAKSKLVEARIRWHEICNRVESRIADIDQVQNVQDELIALNLQLNIAEQQRAKVEAENKELIDRWMKRMRQEAEALNAANEPRLAKG